MDVQGRRQSDNVDDRRKNWRIYEAFRPLHPQPEVVADNQHTRAVETAAERIRKLKGEMTQYEFDMLLEDELPTQVIRRRRPMGQVETDADRASTLPDGSKFSASAWRTLER